MVAQGALRDHLRESVVIFPAKQLFAQVIAQSTPIPEMSGTEYPGSLVHHGCPVPTPVLAAGWLPVGCRSVGCQALHARKLHTVADPTRPSRGSSFRIPEDRPQMAEGVATK